MKTAEEILKSKLDGKITFVNNSDYTFNKVIEAMEEYRLQSHPSPMSAEPTVQQLRDAAKNNPDTFLAGALYVIDNYKLNSHPMSAEQVEELGEKYADSKYDKAIHLIGWSNTKHGFIAGHNTATTPSVKADGWVNIYEDIQGRYIGDSEYSSYQEAFDERDELSTYLETVQISRLPAPPKQQL